MTSKEVTNLVWRRAAGRTLQTPQTGTNRSDSTDETCTVFLRDRERAAGRGGWASVLKSELNLCGHTITPLLSGSRENSKGKG